MVEEELRQRLGAKDALTLSEEIGRGSISREVQYPCEYKTAFAFALFPPDASTLQDVDEFLEAARRGVTHTKIVNLVEGPPDW